MKHVVAVETETERATKYSSEMDLWKNLEKAAEVG